MMLTFYVKLWGRGNHFILLLTNMTILFRVKHLIPKLTRKGSKAYLSSSERYLTLHIIRHRP